MIVVRCITERNPISDTIRFITRAPASGPSHIEVTLPSGAHLGAHADRSGVAVRPPGYTRPTWEHRYGIRLTDNQELVFWQFLRRQLGKPYNYKGIGGILFDRNWPSVNAWFCSELILAAFMRAGIFPLNILPQFAARIDPDKFHLASMFIGHLVSNTTCSIFPPSVAAQLPREWQVPA